MRVRRAISIVFGLLFLWGCGQVEPDAVDPVAIDLSLVRAAHHRVREGAKLRFQRGVFISPSDDSEVGEGIWEAPLVVQELGEETKGIEGVRLEDEEGWILIYPSSNHACFHIYGESRNQSHVNDRLQTWSRKIEKMQQK